MKAPGIYTLSKHAHSNSPLHSYNIPLRPHSVTSVYSTHFDHLMPDAAHFHHAEETQIEPITLQLSLHYPKLILSTLSALHFFTQQHLGPEGQPTSKSHLCGANLSSLKIYNSQVHSRMQWIQSYTDTTHTTIAVCERYVHNTNDNIPTDNSILMTAVEMKMNLVLL